MWTRVNPWVYIPPPTNVCSSITPAAAADPVNSSPAKLATAMRSISLLNIINPC